MLAKLSSARSHAAGETQPSAAPCSWRATRMGGALPILQISLERPHWLMSATAEAVDGRACRQCFREFPPRWSSWHDSHMIRRPS